MLHVLWHGAKPDNDFQLRFAMFYNLGAFSHVVNLDIYHPKVKHEAGNEVDRFLTTLYITWPEFCRKG